MVGVEENFQVEKVGWEVDPAGRGTAVGFKRVTGKGELFGTDTKKQKKEGTKRHLEDTLSEDFCLFHSTANTGQNRKCFSRESSLHLSKAVILLTNQIILHLQAYTLTSDM